LFVKNKQKNKFLSLFFIFYLIIKLIQMKTKKTTNPLDFIELFERFIAESVTGKRVQPNGKKIGLGTIANYTDTLKLLKKFSEKYKFLLRIRPVKRLNARELIVEKNYWKKFYNRFTGYLYDDCGYYDNYMGSSVKNIRTFFSYLNKDKNIDTGQFYKQFYVRNEDISIFPLMPEELNFLIFNKSFEDALSKRLKEAKDFIVFGCTVALRFSDLNALKKNNIRKINAGYFMEVRSIKTNTETLVKLPQYAVDIINRYKARKKLLPQFNISNINKYIKELTEKAGFTQTVLVTRHRRGKPVPQRGRKMKELRFCDVVSSHTMRRTAITTMLSLGVHEQLVRKISGHTPNSKEFYRYVSWSQTLQDRSTEEMFAKLEQKKLK